MKTMIESYLRSMRPPYSRKDALPVTVTLLLLLMIPLTLIYLERENIYNSLAASNASIEPESGVTSGNVQLVNDTTASGGEYAVLNYKATSSLPLKDTNYPIPATGAYFVSMTGSDTSPGSLQAPFRTVGRAVAVTPSGSTIIIREGTYRETVAVSGKRLTFQPYPHEKVWMKGSLVVPTNEWVADGTTWRKDGWTYEFPIQPDQRFINPAYPLAGHHDMVFIDGTPLIQVASKAEVTAGKFYVDYPTDKLYIGSNPSGKTVEATAYGEGLDIYSNASGHIVRGLGFMHYATKKQTSNGAVDVFTTNVTIENNTFAWNAVRGLNMYQATGSVVSGNYFIYNGRNGIGASYGDNLLFEKNVFSFNNQEHFHKDWDAAGLKLLWSKNSIIRDNIVEGNDSIGLWCDESCYNTLIVRNKVLNNYRGIMYEISSKGIVASNLSANNSDDGIRISGSTDVKIYNNTLHGNRHGLHIYEDRRENTDPAGLALGITFNSANITLKNNVISNNNGLTSYTYLLITENAGNPAPPQPLTAEQMITMNDYNAYYRTSSTIPYSLIRWTQGIGTDSVYTNLTAYKNAIPNRETHSISIDNQPTNPFFIDASGGNFHLRPDSIAKNKGEPLPQDVADAINSSLPTPIVTAGSPIDMGAISWQEAL